MLYKKAFTLAEVLITLGVIGIVAAITIPTLVIEAQEKELKNKWKKQFSIISQAFTSIKADNGGNIAVYLDGVTAGGSRPLVEDFANKLKNIGTCLPAVICGNSISNPSVSLTDLYKAQDGTVIPVENLLYGQIVLTDGTYLYFRTYNPNYTLMWVDVNGPLKSPNVLGKDLFILSITKDKIEPMGTTNAGAPNSCSTTTASCSAGKGFHAGTYCAGASCSFDYLYE